MKRLQLLFLLLAFISFASFAEQFTDKSPPVINIGDNLSVDMPLDLNFLAETKIEYENDLVKTEGAITVFDCDLAVWPGETSINIYNTKAISNSNKPHALPQRAVLGVNLEKNYNEVLSLLYGIG